MSSPNLYQKVIQCLEMWSLSTLVLPGIIYFKGEAGLPITPVFQETALWQ